MLKWKIGEVTVTRFVELELPGMTFILPDATPDNLRPLKWLAPHFMTEKWDPIGSIHALVIESQGQRIIVDTCIGNDKKMPLKRWTNRKGPFLSELEEAGFPRDSLDAVLCTHLHLDHVGWNTMLVEGKWLPTFPNARYLFGRVEWEHWDGARTEQTADVLRESVEPIFDAGLETLVETDHKLTDEVWLESTPGHTPGHVSVRIASAGEEAVITGDLMHHPSQMAHPQWACSADIDPDMARATRRTFLDRHADGPVLVIGTHFAAPTAGHVVRDGDAFRFEV